MRLTNRFSRYLLPFALATAMSCSNSDPDPVVPECTVDSDCASNDCNETTGQCVDVPPTSDCTKITINDIILEGVDDESASYAGTPSVNIDGAAGNDLFSFQFFQFDGFTATGTVDLTSAGLNDNYETCSECLLVYADLTEESSGKIYYQSSGTITLSQSPYELNLIGTINDLKLVEVTIADDGSFHSTPVTDGSCIEIEGSFALNYQGWTCDYATTYETGGACDCACGEVLDPDCQSFTATVAGCNAAETCGTDGQCIAACNIFTPTTCATGTCVSRNVDTYAGADYCEADATLNDTASIGAVCADQINTIFCNIDGGIAKGTCRSNDADPPVYNCERLCRVGGTDCAGGETCTFLYDAANPVGTCRPNPA